MYTSLAAIKGYLGIPDADTTHDVLLEAQIAAASAAIDAECGRRFVGVAATRRYGREAVMGRELLLDADLLAATGVTNGDGQPLPPEAYTLWPYNIAPAWGIRILGDRRWAFADDDAAVIVAGQWGYSATPPPQVVAACSRLAAFLFQQRLAPLGVAQLGTAAGDRFGALAVSPELLGDLQSMLRGLRRRSL